MSFTEREHRKEMHCSERESVGVGSKGNNEFNCVHYISGHIPSASPCQGPCRVLGSQC